MGEEKSALILKTSSNDPVGAFTDPNYGDRRWCVEYVGGKKFFLTDEERHYFLAELVAGKTVIQVGPITLTNRFSYAYPVRENNKSKGEDFAIVDGKAVRKNG